MRVSVLQYSHAPDNGYQVRNSKGYIMKNIVLILDSSRGTFIPRDFVSNYLGMVNREHCAKWNIDYHKAEILSLGDTPENEEYWETWDIVLNNAFFMHEGKKYTLHHDGDLWGICIDSMTDTEKQNFGFDND